LKEETFGGGEELEGSIAGSFGDVCLACYALLRHLVLPVERTTENGRVAGNVN
jgi:hypothetical protein